MAHIDEAEQKMWKDVGANWKMLRLGTTNPHV